MEKYRPPYEITDKIINTMISISEKVGKLDALRIMDARPVLRKNGRIRSVHSSLAIEENPLSENDVRAVINGRKVEGPPKEIQEVKNALSVYDDMELLSPYDMKDFLKTHSGMMGGIIKETGIFRTGNEGVFDSNTGTCIFVAPPPDLVPELMANLFGWMNDRRDAIHPLIMSSVFHYEMVFIHPFADGNGRMARLWQNLILTEWNDIFRYIPLESRIKEYQDEYYSVIDSCHRRGDSTLFIEYMMDRIEEAMDQIILEGQKEGSISQYVRRLLAVMENEHEYTTEDLLMLLGLKSRETLRRHYVGPAMSLGLVSMTMPDRPTSRNQRYRKM